MKKHNERTRTLIAALCGGAVFIAVYAAGLCIPEEHTAGNFLHSREPPSFEHPFGTDMLGRDLLLRTVKGLSVSITIGAAASMLSAVIAVLVGAGTAVGSKRLDAVIGWIIDLVMSVPHLILIMLISFVCGRGMPGLLAGITATHWCGLARVIRGEVMQLRSCRYIAVSRRLGKSGGWILRHHMLPHLMPQFFAGLILMFPHAILHEASVSFLGFGLPPEKPAIGSILAESMSGLSAGMWWAAVLPGAVLALLVLLIEKIGSQAAVILNPHTAQK